MPNSPIPPQPSFWWKLVHLDPALLRGFVVAVILALGSLGIFVAPGIPDAFIVLWVATMALVQALWTKGSVTPNARVAVRVPDPVNAPHVVVPGDAVTNAPANEITQAARTVRLPE